MVITWLDFREIMLKTVILANFLKKFRMSFFKVKHYFGHISGMVGLIDVKQKGSALVEFWVQYVTLTFDLTHDLDLGCFKVKFQNSSITGIVGLIDVKWKGSELIWYLTDCMDVSHPFMTWYWLMWPWWGGRMYRIVTGVTSDVGVPSTYLVRSHNSCVSADLLLATFQELDNVF